MIRVAIEWNVRVRIKKNGRCKASSRASPRSDVAIAGSGVTRSAEAVVTTSSCGQGRREITTVATVRKPVMSSWGLFLRHSKN